jgi:hypothetical protein
MVRPAAEPAALFYTLPMVQMHKECIFVPTNAEIAQLVEH